MNHTYLTQVSRKAMYKIRFKKWNLWKYNKSRQISVFARRSQALERGPHTTSKFQFAFQPRYIRLPEPYGLLEQLLHTLNAYFDGSFKKYSWHDLRIQYAKSSIWGSDNFTPGCVKSFVALALRVPCRGETARAEIAWSYVSDAITSMIEREDLQTCVHLASLLRYLHIMERFDLAQAIFSQCAKLAARLKGSTNHPLSILCTQLLKIPLSEVGNLVFVIYRRLADMMENLFGETHPESIIQRIISIKTIPDAFQREHALRSALLKHQKSDKLPKSFQTFLWLQHQNEQPGPSSILGPRDEYNDPVGSFYSFVLDFAMSHTGQIGPRKMKLMKEAVDKMYNLDESVFDELASYPSSRVQWIELSARAMGNFEMAAEIRRVRKMFAKIPTHYDRDDKAFFRLLSLC